MTTKQTNIDQFADIRVQKKELLAEGAYLGKIVKIDRNYDAKGYDYTRIQIRVEDMDITVSYPTNLSFDSKMQPMSALSRFSVRMGYHPGVDFAPWLGNLIGKEVRCSIKHKPVGDRTFCEIEKESVIPA